jgi:hypothetical protein
MRKRLFIFTLLILITSFAFSQANDKVRIKVPCFSENGEITETTYVREYPATIQEAIQTIDLLVEIYGDVSNNYKEQINELVKATREIENELKLAQEKNAALEKIDTVNTNIDKVANKHKVFKDYFESFGIIGEYGVLNNSNEVSLQFGIRLWKFTFSAGPNILIPTTSDSKVNFGFRGAIGIWF